VRAAYNIGSNRLQIRDAATPEAGEGEAIVAVHACAFCGSDIHDFAREIGKEEERIPGHEFCGIVREIAPNPGFATGDAVVVDPIIRCGSCDYCRSGRDNLCRSMAVIGCQGPGAFAEKVCVPVANLHRKPASLSFETATLTDPLAVAIHTTNLVGAGIEDAVCVVFGAGTIGIFTAQVLALRGSGRVFLVDINSRHLEIASNLGNFICINAREEDVASRLQGEEVTLSIELAGGEAPTFEQAVSATAKGGTVMCVAQRPKGSSFDYQRVLFNELKVQGVFGQTRASFREAIRLLESESIRTDGIITDVFHLENIQSALERALEPDSMKVVVRPGSAADSKQV